MKFSNGLKILRLFFKVTLFLGLSLNGLVYANEQSPWTIHGFVAQGVIQSEDSNFVNEDGDVALTLTEIGLNGSYQLSSNLRVAAQAFYLDRGDRIKQGTRVDYLLLDWTVASELDWQLNVVIGRYKNQDWLYSSTVDVPHTRPSIILPQSVYFDISRDISLGSDGVSLKYTSSLDSGELIANWGYGSAPVSTETMRGFVSNDAQGDLEQDFVHHGSVYFTPKDSGWQFGIALLDSDFSYEAAEDDSILIDADTTTQRYMFNVLYNAATWEFAAEALQERFSLYGKESDIFNRDVKRQSVYAQGRYFFENDIIAMLRFEKFYADKDDRDGKKLEESSGGRIPSYFGYSDDLTVGITWTPLPNWQVQAEYHYVKGAGRLAPMMFPDVETNDNKYWDIWAMQLVYWF